MKPMSLHDAANVLRVWTASGEEVAAVAAEDLSHVRALKKELHRLRGMPRFRQRLLHNGSVLEDDARLDAPMDVQLVLLPLVQRGQDAPDGSELVEAAEFAEVAEVEEILQRPQDPDLLGCASSGKTVTALYAASEEGEPAVVRLLLEAQADVNLVAKLEGAPQHDAPFVAACCRGHDRVVRLLLEARAEPNQTRVYFTVGIRHERTVLQMASEIGDVSVVHALLEAGAVQTADGEVPTLPRIERRTRGDRALAAADSV